MENSYRFFRNRECKYFPCHKVDCEEEFNCLFCYCPLYMLEESCGGNFVYEKGVKNCSNCIIPHVPRGYDYINNKLRDYIKEEKKRRASL